MRPLTLVGTILILVAFVIMGVFIVIPVILPSLDSAPFIKNTLQTVLCRPGDTIGARYSTYRTPTSNTRSMDLSCVDSEGQSYDVSGQGIVIGIVGYLVPFLIGLFMVIAGSGKRRRSVQMSSAFVPTNSAAKFDQQGVSFHARGYEVTVDPNGSVIVKDPNGNIRTEIDGLAALKQGFSATHIPLAQRLGELKAAFDAGLITQSEYDAKRQELLNQT